jgi:hypothetical protein
LNRGLDVVLSAIGVGGPDGRSSKSAKLIGPVTWIDFPSLVGMKSMEVLSTIGDIFRDLLIFVAVMTALLVGLLVVIARMPADNPLRRLLTALCLRLGATAAAGAVAIPVEPIPGLDAIYDVAVPILLLLYWISFFRNAARMRPDRSAATATRNRLPMR